MNNEANLPSGDSNGSAGCVKMRGYWIALVFSSLFTTALLGPGLWHYVHGLLQDVGMIVAVIVGFFFHARARQMKSNSERVMFGLLLGSLSLAYGFLLRLVLVFSTIISLFHA